MALNKIRETIAESLRHEEETGALRLALRERLPQLRQQLDLPGEGAEDALMVFISSYVRSVPGCLRLVTAVSKRQGFFEYAAPFLHMAEDYFLCPPDALTGDVGLQALLDEAFLAHRLLEEINDHHVRHLQRSLLPVDMTEANTIVHHLLGDEFASRLEQLVQFTTGQLLDREHVWEQARGTSGSHGGPLINSSSIAGPEPQVRLRIAS